MLFNIQTNKQTGRQTDRQTDTRLTASFPGQPMGKTAPERLNQCHYCNEARDDRLAVVSAGPYANNLHLASDR